MKQIDHETTKRCKELIALLEARLHRSPTTGVRISHGEMNSILDTFQRIVDIAEPI